MCQYTEEEEELAEDESWQDCYYGDRDTCGGDTWTCMTCKESFCDNHNHSTDKGENVECVACERERKESEEPE